MSGFLGLPLGEPGSARARYGRAMQLWASGAISVAQLEAYRVAAADDHRPPSQVLVDRSLPVPADVTPDPAALIRALVAEADRYLSRLPGPGVAEARAGLARWQGGPVTPANPAANAVLAAHLDPALQALAADHPGLAAAIAAAAPHLRWIPYDGYPPDQIGEGFAKGHAYAPLVGDSAAIPAQDYDLGLLVIAPHVLYRDHARAAPELYAPLTGPHGWRFGPDRPLSIKPAHQPVWNPPDQPHLTKVGPVPFLCLLCRARDVQAPAHVIAASDWPQLEALRLDLTRKDPP
ncbi:MAG: dimethylsulfonioproprionate lyase family protein [Paracoccaceae bacterium]